MTHAALTRGRHPQLRLLRFGVVLGIVAVVTLLIVGATNQYAMTIIPALAGMTGFGVEELSLHRTERGRPPLHHRVRAGVVGSSVFVAAVVIASAT